jgi:hypothetical protein
MEEQSSSETSVLTRVTRRNTPEDDIHHSHRRENIKSYNVHTDHGPRQQTTYLRNQRSRFLKSEPTRESDHERKHVWLILGLRRVVPSVTMKCSPLTGNRCSGGTSRPHLQGWSIQQARNNQEADTQNVIPCLPHLSAWIKGRRIPQKYRLAFNGTTRRYTRFVSWQISISVTTSHSNILKSD